MAASSSSQEGNNNDHRIVESDSSERYVRYNEMIGEGTTILDFGGRYSRVNKIIAVEGNLLQYLRNHKISGHNAIKKWSRQILSGIAYLHSETTDSAFARKFKSATVFAPRFLQTCNWGGSPAAIMGLLLLLLLLQQSPRFFRGN
uniref:non-specific serine/threonine protein kinase n=1 Tax=Chenopodium quinoa TaxID=63459 RepID=A0A803MT72_CHEQI